MTDRLDTMGIWDATLAMPEQMEGALTAADNVEGLPHHDSVENVVVLGMGGSGIAGDVLIAGAGPVLSLPVVVVKSYTLPSFVGRGTLGMANGMKGHGAGQVTGCLQRIIIGEIGAGLHIAALAFG